MRCLICGRTALSGGKLCADCRSARKRAFAATVTQPLLAAAGAGSRARLLKPSQSVAATARRAAERGLVAKPSPAEPIKPPSRRTDLMLLAAALSTILIAGAFAAHRLNVPKAESTQVSEQPGIAERSAARGDESGAVAAAQPTPLSELTARAVADMQAATLPATPTASPEAPKRAGARQRTPPVEAVSPPPVDPEPATQALAVAPLVAPAVVREAPRPDPLQVMNENLAQCANGDLIDRIVCDQRVRRQFCDGQWGKVPQCQSGVPNDHGQ
jgi:hypothetical protein